MPKQGLKSQQYSRASLINISKKSRLNKLSSLNQKFSCINFWKWQIALISVGKIVAKDKAQTLLKLSPNTFLPN